MPNLKQTVREELHDMLAHGSEDFDTFLDSIIDRAKQEGIGFALEFIAKGEGWEETGDYYRQLIEAALKEDK